jgi:hypothetical protein
MTEQERAISGEAYSRLVEELLSEHFALDDSGSTEEGGFGSQREAARNDLIRHVRNAWRLENDLNNPTSCSMGQRL